MDSAPVFDAGTSVGDLRIERQIGAGAFGKVYLARDSVLDRAVALKVCAAQAPSNHEGSSDEAWSEARFTAKFRHNNIVTLYRIHPIAEGWVGYEMEYVAGGTLTELADRHPQPDPSVSLIVARGIAAAVRAAHSANVIHGDIKPSNILLAEDGTPKLTDFGLASHQRVEATESGYFTPGTPLYMAPEVLMGAPATTASDVWSLGMTLFELFAGAYPFRPADMQQLFSAIQNETPRFEGREFPPLVEAAIRRCLSKNAADRPSAEEVHNLLQGSVRPRRIQSGAEGHSGWFVGREADLEWLLKRFDDIGEIAPPTVFLKGEPGIGKTALIRSLRSQLSQNGIPTAIVKDWRRSGLVATLLFAIRRELQQSDALRKTPSPGWVLDELLDSKAGVLESRGQLFDAVRAALDILCATGCSCVVIEDIHDASIDDVRFVRGVLRRCHDLPVQFVITCRVTGRSALLGDVDHPENALTLESESDVVVRELSPLSDEAIARVVAGRRFQVDPVVTRRITQDAEGNPLLALEVFRFLVDSGGIEILEDNVRPGKTWKKHELPDRIQHVVLARVDRLSAEDQALLELAAVAGRRFDASFLAEILDQPLMPILRSMQTLYRRTSLVVPEDHAFAFSHALVHESIEHSIAPALHRELSRLMAEQLEAAESKNDEALGRHWIHAGDQTRARPYLIRTGNKAERRQENQRAVEHFEMAGLGPASSAEVDVREHAESLLALSGCYSDLGNGEGAERIFRSIHQAARDANDEHLRHQVTARSARILLNFRGRNAVDEKELRDAVDALPPGKSRACGWYGLGLLAKQRGTYDSALQRFRNSYRDYRAIDRFSGCSDALDQMGTVAKRQGRLRGAVRLYRLAAVMSERVGRRINACVSRFNEALTQFRRGKIEGTSVLLGNCVRVLEFEGAAQLAAQARTLLATVLWADGRGDEAMECFATTERALQGQRFLPAEQNLRYLRARIAAIRGEIAIARRDVDIARATLGETDPGESQTKLDRLEVLILSLGSQPSEARWHAERMSSADAEHPSSATADDLILTLALATLAGTSTARLPGVGLARRIGGRRARAALIAARILKTARAGDHARDTCLRELLAEGSSYDRALLHGLALTLRNSPDDRKRARQIAAQLGTRIFDPWISSAIEQPGSHRPDIA